MSKNRRDNSMKIRKAIIPAAGLGTRFLPMTKAIPKEMLPVVDKPVIQYVVEECVNSGIEEILIVIGSGKRAIEEHFGRSTECERELVERGKPELSDEIRRISEMANIYYVWQNELKGLGDAVLSGQAFCDNEPFALLLGDTIVESAEPKQPVLKQLLNIQAEYQASVVALEQVPESKVSQYGIIEGAEIAPSIYQVNDTIEKPTIDEAPSNLAFAGRYIFQPDIFDYLAQTQCGKNNEIQLTDAMREMLKSRPMFGCKFEGKRHDLGNRVDFIKTNLDYALKAPELRDEIVAYMKYSFSKL